MAKMCQILRQRKERQPAKWEFVAHGARYTKLDAIGVCNTIFACSGDKTKIIEI